MGIISRSYKVFIPVTRAIISTTIRKWTILFIIWQTINNKFHCVPLSLRAQTKLTATLSAARSQNSKTTLTLPNKSGISNFVLRAERVDTIDVVFNSAKIHSIFSFISHLWLKRMGSNHRSRSLGLEARLALTLSDYRPIAY